MPARIPIPPRETLQQAYTQLGSIVETAKHFGTSYETCRMWLKTNKIEIGQQGRNNRVNRRWGHRQ